MDWVSGESWGSSRAHHYPVDVVRSEHINRLSHTIVIHLDFFTWFRNPLQKNWMATLLELNFFPKNIILEAGTLRETLPFYCSHNFWAVIGNRSESRTRRQATENATGEFSRHQPKPWGTSCPSLLRAYRKRQHIPLEWHRSLTPCGELPDPFPESKTSGAHAVQNAPNIPNTPFPLCPSFGVPATENLFIL